MHYLSSVRRSVRHMLMHAVGTEDTVDASCKRNQKTKPWCCSEPENSLKVHERLVPATTTFGTIEVSPTPRIAGSEVDRQILVGLRNRLAAEYATRPRHLGSPPASNCITVKPPDVRAHRSRCVTTLLAAVLCLYVSMQAASRLSVHMLMLRCCI